MILKDKLINNSVPFADYEIMEESEFLKFNFKSTNGNPAKFDSRKETGSDRKYANAAPPVPLDNMVDSHTLPMNPLNKKRHIAYDVLDRFSPKGQHLDFKL